MLVGVDKARFKQQVIPGDQLILSVELKNRKGIIWVFDAKATVDGKVVASAELMCAAKEGAA
jgi:3-hydroxyacyl-[acyl-carrier-protein] dehydratase